MTRPSTGIARPRRLRQVRLLAAALALGWFSQLAPAADTYSTPPPGAAGTARPAATQGVERKRVLILSATQYGLPVSDAVIAGAVAALRNKGLSANDLYVEHLDLIRHDDPRWRAAIAGVLRDKLAKANVGLVIIANQGALEFLLQEGYDLVPADTPVLTTFALQPTVTWRGTPRPLINIAARGDLTETLRHGLELFPRTRRVFLVASADDRQYPLYAPAAKALAALPTPLEVEDSRALTHGEMLQRVATLPPDTLVLLGAYFNDRTGRTFIPAEVVAEVARRANAPVLGLYEAHIRLGLAGGVVVADAAVGRRAGEIGFELLSGARRLDTQAGETVVPSQPLFDWSQLQRWGADPARLPEGTVFLHRPRTLWSEYRNTVLATAAAILALSGLVLALALENRRRRRVESTLRDSEERLRLAQENAQVGVWDRDIKTGKLYLSPEAARLAGLPSGMIVTDSQEWRSHVLAEDLPQADASLAESIARGESFEVEFRVRLDSGEIRWLLSKGKAQYDSGGQAVRVMGVHLDITERKRAEQALLEYHQQLEAMVDERTAELKEAMHKAEAANLAKSAFLANMSHEIRTPMNAIVGMSHLIRRDGLKPQQEDRLGKLESAAHHLLEILNAILDLSKIEAGKFTLEALPLRVESVVANVLSMLGERAQAKGLRLLSEVDPLPRNLVGDPTRLQQALLNYANNALKFTETGSVMVRARLAEQDEQGALIRFEVEDTGPGIDAAVIARLFAAFEQADSSTTRKSGGTGLGLAITKKLAELMGGQAGVQSAPGSGSLFWFTARLGKAALEKIDTEEAAGQSTGATLKRRHAGTRILVVEDNDINREVAQAILEDAGFVVDLAEDGMEAVVMADANAYRLVLMDMQMPRMDGLEAAREIRKTHPAGKLPIIAMTANAFSEDKARCFAAGMDDFVSKPVMPDELYAVLQGWLERTPDTGQAQG
jgi:PAS domain S-box-containing protein